MLVLAVCRLFVLYCCLHSTTVMLERLTLVWYIHVGSTVLFLYDLTVGVIALSIFKGSKIYIACAHVVAKTLFGAFNCQIMNTCSSDVRQGYLLTCLYPTQYN